MFSVADELTISGLDPELRAVVDRYISAKGSHYGADRTALRCEYERGYAAGVADARARQPTLPLDGEAAA